MSLSNLNRYLIEFSYVGARFSGVAKQINVAQTVHNVIESNLLKNNFDLKSNINISSRTDAGVHAISNTAHFDLVNNTDHKDLSFLIKQTLNKSFIDNNLLVRILNCRRVSPNFVARHAKSRTYLYRLGLSVNGPDYWKELERIKKVDQCLKNNSGYSSLSYSIPFMFPLNNFTNIIDNYFITEIKEPFDKDLFIRAIDKFNGEHNFSAFTTKQGREEMFQKKKNPVKNVELKTSLNGDQFLSDYIHFFDEKYKIIDIEIKAGSFLYRMIRKMIGAATDVAKGSIPLSQIEQMFETPEKFYNEKLTTILKPNGLYLKSVEYDQDDLKFKE